MSLRDVGFKFMKRSSSGFWALRPSGVEIPGFILVCHGELGCQALGLRCETARSWPSFIETWSKTVMSTRTPHIFMTAQYPKTQKP